MNACPVYRIDKCLCIIPREMPSLFGLTRIREDERCETSALVRRKGVADHRSTASRRGVTTGENIVELMGMITRMNETDSV